MAPKKTIIAEGNDLSKLLNGYKEYKGKYFKNIKQGDSIRYMVNGHFRKGGQIKSTYYPDYLVCVNWVAKATWCVQLKEPTLKIWVKTLETKKKEKDEMYEVFKKYKKGILVEKKK